MASVACVLLLFICQTTVRADGIVIPLTSSSSNCKPKEQGNLKLFFKPKNETNKFYVPIGVRSDLNTSRLSESNTKAIPSSNGAEAPINVIAMSPPNIPLLDLNPKLTLDSPHQMQSFNPNVATNTVVNQVVPAIPNTIQTPQVSVSTQIDSSKVERNVNSGDSTKVSPAPVVTIPSYFVLNKDLNPDIKTPLPPVKLDSLPSNIYKIKLNDAQPIFIDLSKSNSYKVPSTAFMPTVTKEPPVQNLNSPPERQISPTIQSTIYPQQSYPQFVQNTSPIGFTDHSTILPIPTESVPTSTIVKIEEKPLLSPYSNTPTILQDTVQSPNVREERSQLKDTKKYIFPLSNVNVNYNPSVLSQDPTVNGNRNINSANVPKTEPIDNKISFSVTPSVNFVPNTSQSCQCDHKLSNYQSNNCVRPSECFYHYLNPSQPSNIVNQNSLPVNKPIPISQLPYMNPNSNIISTLPSMAQLPNIITNPKIESIPSIAQSLGAQPTYTTTTDSLTSKLSCSLESLVSVLTAGLLNKFFDSPINSTLESVDVPNDTFASVTLPIESFISTSTTPCPMGSIIAPTIDSSTLSVPPRTLERSEDILLTSRLSGSCSKTSSNSKPYLSSVTINITPTEPSNDIVILL